MVFSADCATDAININTSSKTDAAKRGDHLHIYYDDDPYYDDPDSFLDWR